MLIFAIACTDPAPDAPDSEQEVLDSADSSVDTGEPPSEPVLPEWDPETFLSVLEVGPGQDYESPGDVPWEGIGGGTLVRIHWRDDHYRDKWVIDVPGTEELPVVVVGVPNDKGELPVIQGKDATTRTAVDYWNENRSVIKVGGSRNPGLGASWVWIQQLEIRGAYSQYGFTDDQELAATYGDNAAAVHIEAGENIHVVGCVLTDSGNGLFVSSGASDVLVRANHVYGNGNVGSAYEHNSYTESEGIVFEYNWYEGLREGADGNNLKDRSAGLVVRYNWIEDANRQLDLVDTSELSGHEDYGDAWVYGNVLVEGEDEGNSQIVHFGGDSGDTERYRNGTLYFWHNTVHSKRPGNTTLLRLSSSGESADVVNNIVWAEGALGILNGDGSVRLEGNWLSTWTDGFEAGGPVTDDGNSSSDEDPALDERYHPTEPIEGAVVYEVDGHPVQWQYRRHQDREARTDTEDAGAYN
ncbi:MAG TPA: right-handed parallel beta-helix repeat-containing protein [Myxococcota bacterium]|nr:right-handed parallel beta-helix repeat-containing protein [Myxococcota bacterium]